MKKSEIKLIQSALYEIGFYSDDIDGLMGSNSRAAIHQYLSANSGLITSESCPDWSSKRKTVAALQLLCAEKELEVGKIDGLYGPQTEAVSEQLALLTKKGSLGRGFGDIHPVRANPNNFPTEEYQQLVAFYGPPCEATLTRVPCPWKLRLDWDLTTSTNTISIHEKLADSLALILQKIFDHYGDERIKKHGLDRYGGSYNCRKKRGSTTSWSTHAWGIAIDWFPSQNKLKWRSDRASLAHPDLDFFWECWEEEGWLSLGRTEDRDWMHVQAAKRMT